MGVGWKTVCLGWFYEVLFVWTAWDSLARPTVPPPIVAGTPPTAGRLTGQLSLAWYLPFLVSCCRMFLIKWIFLKFFGLGEPERVRHLKNKVISKTRSVASRTAETSPHKDRKEDQTNGLNHPEDNEDNTARSFKKKKHQRKTTSLIILIIIYMGLWKAS